LNQGAEPLTSDHAPDVFPVLDLARDAEPTFVGARLGHTVTVDDVEVVAVRYSRVVHLTLYSVHITSFRVL
jgi:hypothetical protein